MWGYIYDEHSNSTNNHGFNVYIMSRFLLTTREVSDDWIRPTVNIVDVAFNDI